MLSIELCYCAQLEHVMKWISRSACDSAVYGSHPVQCSWCLMSAVQLMSHECSAADVSWVSCGWCLMTAVQLMSNQCRSIDVSWLQCSWCLISAVQLMSHEWVVSVHFISFGHCPSGMGITIDQSIESSVSDTVVGRGLESTAWYKCMAIGLFR